MASSYSDSKFKLAVSFVVEKMDVEYDVKLSITQYLYGSDGKLEHGASCDLSVKELLGKGITTKEELDEVICPEGMFNFVRECQFRDDGKVHARYNSAGAKKTTVHISDGMLRDLVGKFYSFFKCIDNDDFEKSEKNRASFLFRTIGNDSFGKKFDMTQDGVIAKVLEILSNFDYIEDLNCVFEDQYQDPVGKYLEEKNGSNESGEWRRFILDLSFTSNFIDLFDKEKKIRDGGNDVISSSSIISSSIQRGMEIVDEIPVEEMETDFYSGLS